MNTADAVVIGGGIAGVSVGAGLAARGLRVVVAEMEATLAFHTTGRSAAQYLQNYGNDVVRRLTIASADHFASAADVPLWSPRSFLRVGDERHAERLRQDAAEARRLVPSTEFLDGEGARQLVPALGDRVAGALHEPGSMELDVAAIHQGFVTRLQRGDGTIITSRPVTGLVSGRDWTVEFRHGDPISTPVVVNAAGAWGDEVAVLAGAHPIPLYPRRRTLAIAAVPEEFDATEWPLIAFENDHGSMDGYCKPEAGGLLVSPADETPSLPCDARPEEIDVALALDTLERWTSLGLRHVRSSWAGLRTFAADRSPVAGFAPETEGFFWMVGQGGYGIQMAPALADAATGLIVDGRLPTDLVDAGVTAADLAPDRDGLHGDLTADH